MGLDGFEAVMVTEIMSVKRIAAAANSMALIEKYFMDRFIFFVGISFAADAVSKG